MRTPLLLIPILLIGAALTMAMGTSSQVKLRYTTDFGFEADAIFLPDGSNPYFSLRPGKFLRFEGEDEGEFVELEIRVLEQIRPFVLQVRGQWIVATTRVVEEREWIDGELGEVVLNYYACCPTTENIYHFGEDVRIYARGKVVSNEGSWLAGEGGAHPGLVMPGSFLLGSRYYQQMAPGVSMDRAEHVEMGLEVETPAGVFKNCVVVLETSELEEDEEVIKIYAPGTGQIVDEALELVEYHE